MTIPELVEIGGIRLNTASSHNHIRIVFQNLNVFITPEGLPGQFIVDNDTVSSRQIANTLFEFFERINRNLRTARQPALQYVARFLLADLAGKLLGILRWSHFVGQFGSAVKVYSVI